MDTLHRRTLPNHLPMLFVWGLLAILLLKIGISFLIVNRGFDVTDEGCIMLWYVFPDKDPNPFYYFHQMVLGFLPFEWSIAGVRILKNLSDLVVLGVVSMAVYRSLPAINRHWGTAILLVSVVGLGFYSQFFARAYYEGDMSLLFASLSLCLPIIGLSTKSKAWAMWAFVAGGLFIGLQFFNKFSTSAICLVLLWAYAVGNRVLIGIPLAALGALFGAGVFFSITGHSPAAWFEEYKTGYDLVIAPMGYNPIEQLAKYGIEGLILLLLALLPLGAYAIVGFIFKPLRSNSVFAVVLVAASIVLYLLSPQIYSDAHNRWLPLVVHFWYAPLITVVLYLFVYQQLWRQMERGQWWLLVMLLAIPFAAFMGSATSLNVSVASYLMPWYAILGFFTVRHMSRSALLPVVALSAVAFVYLHLVYPFRLLGPITAQTETIQTPVSLVKVDNKLAAFVSQTDDVLTASGIRQPYPMVALHNLPGLVYLLGGYSPATPWYFEAKWLGVPEIDRQLAEFNRIHLARIKLFEQQPPVFLINEYALAEVEADVLASGFDLANDYLPPKPVYNPYVAQENEMLSRKQSADLLVFIPKPQQ